MCDCGCATWSHLHSPMHRLPAALKMSAALALVITLVTLPPTPWLLGGTAALLIAVLIKSRVPIRFFIRRLLLLEPFVLSVALLPLLQGQGLGAFAAIACRTTLSIATLLLLANTTPLDESLAVLRRLRVPSVMVTTMALMARYLGLLHEESARMRAARAARTFRTDRRTVWRDSASVAAALLVRSSIRAERVYDAMCARGWR